MLLERKVIGHCEKKRENDSPHVFQGNPDTNADGVLSELPLPLEPSLNLLFADFHNILNNIIQHTHNMIPEWGQFLCKFLVAKALHCIQPASARVKNLPT